MFPLLVIFIHIFEVFSFVPSWRVGNNFMHLYQFITIWCQLSVGCTGCFCFFLFCLVLTLISTTNGNFVSNVSYQRFQHSAFLLTVPGVWDRPCCLWKTILVVTEINLSTINKMKINKWISKQINVVWLDILFGISPDLFRTKVLPEKDIRVELLPYEYIPFSPML